MKLITFDEFVKLPEGTIFSYYYPVIFVGLWKKGETIYFKEDEMNDPTDYFQISLLPGYWSNPPKNENEVISVGIKERWGEYDYSQKYCVYEKEDIETLKSLLN